MIGLLLIALGVVALTIPTLTYFTTERAADTSFFKVDVSRPHTIVINPLAGAALLTAGVVLMLVGRPARLSAAPAPFARP